MSSEAKPPKGITIDGIRYSVRIDDYRFYLSGVPCLEFKHDQLGAYELAHALFEALPESPTETAVGDGYKLTPGDAYALGYNDGGARYASREALIRKAHEPSALTRSPAEEYCRLLCAWKGGGPCLADDCPRKAAPTNDLVAPRPGDIWQEQDPRQPRLVLVIYVDDTHATIRQVAAVTGPGRTEYGPQRRAQLKRFNGKRSGYALHHRSALDRVGEAP